MCSDKRIHLLVVLAAVASLILTVSALGAEQEAAVPTELPQPQISQTLHRLHLCSPQRRE